eukprot:gb/GFBE01022940.1/.p1 GENE.gb/GFBE01022940.1/~~gb/GFBE01022940.1/.p1  ORF type:complete len:244 (+),score=54.22 gb/GFBE01022940.1/:1-732(+)
MSAVAEEVDAGIVRATDSKETADTDTPASRGFREIYAVYDSKTVRVYQAYNDAIADAAVAANSFRAPMEAGLWSSERMTWIKPSAVWMAYRCGWTMLKDKNQTRVLALDVSRSGFEQLLMGARLSHGSDKGSCKEGSVTVQWDPEREMAPEADGKNVFTQKQDRVRSIQIGLRGKAVETLLDPSFLIKITDVTEDFRAAYRALTASPPNLDAARAALWPCPEAQLPVPGELKRVLQMDCASEC